MNKRHILLSLSLLTVILAALAVGLGGAHGAAAGPDEALPNAGWLELGEGSASGGGISNTGPQAESPSMAIGPDSAPVVAWSDAGETGYEIFVRRWDGEAWVEMGSSASGDGISNNPDINHTPSVAFDHDGAPIVAWNSFRPFANTHVFVRRWDGEAWVEMGEGSATDDGMSDNTGDAEHPSLAVGPDGPIIAWQDNSSGNWEIYARRWDGEAWVEMGEGSASGGGISNSQGFSRDPSLAIGPDGPVVAWSDVSSGNWEIYLRRWDGEAWVQYGGSATGPGISLTPGDSSYPSLAIGPDGPVVAWEDTDSNGVSQIYVRRLDDEAWGEWDGSATDGGISDGTMGSHGPSLAIGADNSIIVAWFEGNPFGGISQIYVRRSDGSDWFEMGEGSATGGGVSDTTLSSSEPSLAIGPTGESVLVWAVGVGDQESAIYARRYPAACYTLTLNHSGEGADPTAAPANSEGCPAGQYIAGETVALTAAPAAGWRVGGWSATADDASTETTNTVVMPAANHSAAVAYEQVEWRLFLPAALR